MKEETIMSDCPVEARVSMTDDITYRGYTIRTAGDAVGFGSPWRYIIKQRGEIVSEQSSLEAAKQLVDEMIEENQRG
jgi:hypothetical protein